ncbi:reverse transcriptase domain-containing protein [Tanacetum coccineum]
MLPPRKRFKASPSTSQQETTVEAMIKAVTPGLGLSSTTTTPVLPVIGETIHQNIPLEELPLEHFKSTEQEIEALHARAEVVEQKVIVLQDALRIDQLEMAELQSQAQDAEALLNQCKIGRIGDRASNGSAGRVEHTTHGCSYKEFLNCKPHNFSKTEATIRLTHWFKKMESVFQIRNCAENCQLALLCPTMVSPEYKMVERVRAKTAKNGENKRKWEGNYQNNSGQQNKRKEVVRAYTAGPDNKKDMLGSFPSTTSVCCITIVHALYSATTARRLFIWLETNACPKLKNLNRGNHGGNGGNGRARRKAFVFSGGEPVQDPNVVMGTFLLNNRYATILIDSGADRSFVSTAFSPLINIAPTTLDIAYTIELANGKRIGSNTII